MAKYIMANTSAGPSGRRPWPARLHGVGDYRKSVVTIPTQSYSNLPDPGAVTGGLGLDLSSIPTWAWVLGIGVGAYWLLGKKRGGSIL